MKQIFLSIVLSLSSISFSQTPISEADKIAAFCKVWGFLKYHHPSVAKGKYDWDQAFIEHLKTVSQLNTKGQLNQFYYQWISGLGELKKNAKRRPPASAILSNYNFTWIKDSAVFSEKVIELLERTQNNSRAKNHYVKKKYLGLAAPSYINEKAYKDSVYPSTAMRLLTLARYWNIVNYFYPYKYLTDTKWEDVLKEFVPKVIVPGNPKEYRLALLELFSRLNDSHTGFNPRLYIGKYKLPPFNNKIIDDKIIILDLFNDSICRKHDIRYGDVILAINDKSIKSIIDYYSKYVSASNYASLLEQLAPQFLWTDILDSAVITCERDGEVFDKVLPEYSWEQVRKDSKSPKRNELPKPLALNYKVHNGNIVYIDLGKIKSKREAKVLLKKVNKTDAVILDIRNYPNSAIFRPITNFFCTSRKPFVRFARQSIKYPGALIWSRTFSCGKKNGSKYKGKVAVLTDESTVSFAEYFTMALKTIPHVVLIGSHTAGADGSNHPFKLPGNITTSFSNEAVYYPNGGETQRKGIVPDILVTPTIEGIRLRKDEVIEKAIEVLSKK